MYLNKFYLRYGRFKLFLWKRRPYQNVPLGSAWKHSKLSDFNHNSSSYSWVNQAVKLNSNLVFNISCKHRNITFVSFPFIKIEFKYLLFFVIYSRQLKGMILIIIFVACVSPFPLFPPIFTKVVLKIWHLNVWFKLQK